ncbi:hypothetical protein C8R46DRAFT_1277253 [Mycena filopes]|nr:hypothetical protein C8R46DRAFT_1277253 [Mycena filopes]
MDPFTIAASIFIVSVLLGPVVLVKYMKHHHTRTLEFRNRYSALLPAPARRTLDASVDDFSRLAPDKERVNIYLFGIVLPGFLVLAWLLGRPSRGRFVFFVSAILALAMELVYPDAPPLEMAFDFWSLRYLSACRKLIKDPTPAWCFPDVGIPPLAQVGASTVGFLTGWILGWGMRRIPAVLRRAVRAVSSESGRQKLAGTLASTYRRAFTRFTVCAGCLLAALKRVVRGFSSGASSTFNWIVAVLTWVSREVGHAFKWLAGDVSSAVAAVIARVLSSFDLLAGALRFTTLGLGRIYKQVPSRVALGVRSVPFKLGLALGVCIAGSYGFIKVALCLPQLPTPFTHAGIKNAAADLPAIPQALAFAGGAALYVFDVLPRVYRGIVQATLALNTRLTVVNNEESHITKAALADDEDTGTVEEALATTDDTLADPRDTGVDEERPPSPPTDREADAVPEVRNTPRSPPPSPTASDFSVPGSPSVSLPSRPSTPPPRAIIGLDSYRAPAYASPSPPQILPSRQTFKARRRVSFDKNAARRIEYPRPIASGSGVGQTAVLDGSFQTRAAIPAAANHARRTPEKKGGRSGARGRLLVAQTSLSFFEAGAFA